VTDRYHAIYVEDKWTLTKVDPHMFAWTLHPNGGKELSSDLAEGNTCNNVNRKFRQELKNSREPWLSRYMAHCGMYSKGDSYLDCYHSS
jgi:hypothetical protein